MFKVLYRGEHRSAPLFADEGRQTLGALCFTSGAALRSAENRVAACQHVPMRVLGDDDILQECFYGSGPTSQAQHQNISYRYSSTTLFGTLALSESEFPDSDAGSSLQAASKIAYEQIFSLLQQENFPYVLRFWNYMADINGTTHNLERYRQFNLGRQQAFDARGADAMNNLPAACALGTAGGPLTIAFLAGRAPSLPIENPRQVSAYDYPVQYGPRSPLFSRASVATVDQKRMLFLSGTASIVGHATVHVHDLVAQTEETVTNIAAVLAETARKTGAACGLADLDYIVYIRNEKDFPIVRQVLEQRIGSHLKAFYLQADICRADLLVEIEGSAELPF